MIRSGPPLSLAASLCLMACSVPEQGWPAAADAADDSATPVATGTLSGSIQDSTGATVSDAAVTSSPLGYETRTDAGGTYTINELPVGDYQIVVQADGYATTWSDPVTVDAGLVTPLDLTLDDDSSTDEEP